MNKDYARHVDKYPGVVQGADGFCPQKCADFIIRENNGVYEAVEGSTGKIVYKSTNPNSIFQSVFDSNITIFVTGEYFAEGTILISNLNDIVINFAGILHAANNTNGPVIRIEQCNNIRINNIIIDGNSVGQDAIFGVIAGIGGTVNGCTGVSINNSPNCIVTNSYIYDCRNTGVFVANVSPHSGVMNSKIYYCGWNGVTLGTGNAGEQDFFCLNNEIAYAGDVGCSSYAPYSLIKNNYIHHINGTNGSNNANWGIGVEGLSQRNQIIGNIIQENKYNIVTATTSQNNIISHNAIYDSVHLTPCVGVNSQGKNDIISENVIQLSSSGTNVDQIYIKNTGIRVLGNTIIGGGGSAGIKLSAEADNCVISQNNFLSDTNFIDLLVPANAINNQLSFNIFSTGRAVALRINCSEPTTIISNNIGYVVENSGVSTGTGAQQTIAHGLVGTPSVVILSSGDAVSNAFQSAAADVTNIYVTADAGETWYWYAIYKP